jgi:outer membrane protein OmpA-like peptidoglycan-associated protein
MYKLLKISILLLLPMFGFGQKTAKEWLKDAETYFENQRYERSLSAFLEYRKLEPTNSEVFAKLGASCYEIGDIDDAKRYLNYALEQKRVDDKTYLYMAKTLHANHEFKEAILQYKKYLTLIKSSASDRKMVKDDIKRCAAGLNFPDNNSKVFVQNMGDKVNSNFDDFGPVISPSSDDKIYFSSSRIGTVGGLRSEDGLRDDKLGAYCSDMFSTKVSNGDWGEPKALSYLINSPRCDVILDFSSDGKQMYYYRGYNLFSGDIFVDTFKLFDERTLKTTPLKSPMNSEYGDGTPFFVNDTMMLFSSRMKSGRGGLDLYYSLYENGAWKTPQSFGNQVNSLYDEICPFLATDGRTLYFSSNNPKGVGSFDIYKSVFDEEKLLWSVPENLGFPINSAGEDAYFRLSSDGTKGYFSSKRKEGMGERDLYIAYFKSALAEQDNVSVPDLFFKVRKKDLEKSENNDDKPENKIVNYKFSALTYDKDADLVSAKNKISLDNMVALLTKNPTVKVVLVSHSEETSTLDLDAFLSVKRAEKVSEYLIKNGCKASQISVMGCGSSFTLAQNTTDGNPNKIGQKFNRRVDLFFQNYQKLPVKLEFEEQIIPDYMQSGEYFRFKNIYKGLSYRVQIASMKQLYQGEVLKKYPDVTIEKALGNDNYDFSIGIFASFESANNLQKDLVKQGITGATVVPYVSGFNVTDNVKNLLPQYPDLQNYAAKKK